MKRLLAVIVAFVAVAGGVFPLVRDWRRENDINIGLVDAAGRGDLPMVKSLLQRGADINAIDRIRFGFTPLIYATFYNQFGVIPFLIESGADVNLPDRDGQTPLMWAVVHGDEALETVEYLIAHGARLDAKDKMGHTALEQAKAAPPRPEVLEALRAAEDRQRETIKTP